MSSHRVLAMPTPEPGVLDPRRQRPALAFPLLDPRTRWFHLARGAVFQAIRELELDGADVLVPAWHHGVEVEALVAAGARPVFYGLRDDLSADLASLAVELTPATRALYVIHYLGLPQPMPELERFAERHGLRLMEDCALALFSSDGALPLGARGDASIFCLYKTLPLPDGGALWTPARRTGPALETPSLASSLQAFASGWAAGWARRSHAADRIVGGTRRIAAGLRKVVPMPSDAYPVGHARFVPGEERLGISLAARLLVDRSDPREIVSLRRRNFLELHDRLGPLRQRIFELPEGMCPLFYPLVVDDKARVRRQLGTVGIEAIDFWRHGSPLVPRRKFPLVERLREHLLELPIHQDVTPADIERIAAEVRRAIGVRAPATRPARA